VTWTALKYVCDRTGRKFFTTSLGKTLFDHAVVGSSAAPGTVSTQSNNSIQVNVNMGGALVLDFNIAPGGATGIVETNASAYGVSLITAGDSHTCEPLSTNPGGSKLPFSGK
jgi:hypothetical protein